MIVPCRWAALDIKHTNRECYFYWRICNEVGKSIPEESWKRVSLPPRSYAGIPLVSPWSPLFPVMKLLYILPC